MEQYNHKDITVHDYVPPLGIAPRYAIIHIPTGKILLDVEEVRLVVDWLNAYVSIPAGFQKFMPSPIAQALAHVYPKTRN